MEASGYYAPLATVAILRPAPAWTVYVGTTPDGKWVAEYHSKAASRYQRSYHGSREEAEREVGRTFGQR